MLYEQAVLWLNLTLQFQAVIARHYKGYICKCKAFARDKLPVQFKLVYQPGQIIDKSHGRFRTGLSIVLRETVDIHNKFLYIVVYEK